MSPLDRLRLTSELSRLMRERSAIPAGPLGAMSMARNAAALTNLLRALQPSAVSIYNSSTPTPKDAGMTTETTPPNPWIRRLMPLYVKHAEALAVVRELEAAGEKPTGAQKSAVTRTRTELDRGLEEAGDYGRKPEQAPKVEELAAIYDAQVAAAKAEREALAGAPTLTVDELTAKAFAALDATKPHPKYKTREAKAETMVDGAVITAVAADDMASRRIGAGMKRTIRFLQDGKVISKDSLLKVLGGRERQDINEALRSAFEAQAPSLEQEYRTYIEDAFARQKEENGGKVPAFVEEREPAAQIIGELRMHSIVHREPGQRAWLELDEAKLAEQAKRYGEETAVQWFYKTNAKLGALTNPTLHEDRGGWVSITGERAGRKVSMQQQRVLKFAPVARRLFHQFPARLYVDGKFVTEEQYRKLFADK